MAMGFLLFGGALMMGLILATMALVADWRERQPEKDTGSAT